MKSQASAAIRSRSRSRGVRRCAYPKNEEGLKMEGLAWEGPCDAGDRAGVGGVGALAVREREARARSDTLPEAVTAFAKAQIGRKEEHGLPK